MAWRRAERGSRNGAPGHDSGYGQGVRLRLWLPLLRLPGLRRVVYWRSQLTECAPEEPPATKEVRFQPTMKRREAWCPCLRSEDVRSIYEHLWESMVAAAQDVVHDRPEGGDVAQEAMVRVAQRYCDLRGTGSVKAWARSIARRLALNRLRESSRRRKREELAAANVELLTDPEEFTTARERLNRLTHALEGIPTPAARILRMRIVEERSLGEIALLEDLPIGTIMSRLARAKQRLQRSMDAPFRLSAAQATPPAPPRRARPRPGRRSLPIDPRPPSRSP